MAIPLKEEFFLVVEAQLCERRNDALAERSLSRGSTRGWKATTSIQALLYSSKNRLFFGASRGAVHFFAQGREVIEYRKNKQERSESMKAKKNKRERSPQMRAS